MHFSGFIYLFGFPIATTKAATTIPSFLYTSKYYVIILNKRLIKIQDESELKNTIKLVIKMITDNKYRHCI